MGRKPEKRDFFYVEEGCYDCCAEKALPFYHEGQRLAASLLGLPRVKKTVVVDLGVGTGVTAIHVLTAYPNARVIGVDLFDEMLVGAHRRLARFQGRVELVKADNTDFLRKLKTRVDGITSAMCIHHLDAPQKRELFRRAYSALRPGGRFVMFDWTSFRDPALRDWGRSRVLDNLERKVSDAGYRKRWTHHWTKVNKPSPADKMIAWLEAAGFEAETAYRDGEIAVLVARKPG